MTNIRDNTSVLSSASPELLDSSRKTAVQHQAETLLRSAAYAGLQAPVTAVTQLLDRGFGTTWSETTRLIDPCQNAKPWTLDWHVQQVGSAAGMMLPFLGVKYGLGKMFRSPMAEAAIASGSQNLSREELRAIAQHELRLTIGSGAVYGGFLTPTKPEEGDLLKARLNHAATGALTFAALGYGTMGLKELGGSKYLKGSLAGGVLRNDIAATVLAGAPAGVVAADAHSILAGKGFATMDQRLQSAYSFSMVGGFLATAHKGADLFSGAGRKSRLALESETSAQAAVEAGRLAIGREPAKAGLSGKRSVIVADASEPTVPLLTKTGASIERPAALPEQRVIQAERQAGSRESGDRSAAPEPPATRTENYATMMAELQGRLKSGELVVPEIPKPSESAPVTYESAVQKLPRLKTPENRPAEVPSHPREFREAFIDEVAEPVRVYRKAGLETELVVPESFAARQERFAQLTDAVKRGGSEAADAAVELAKPEMQEMKGLLTPAEVFALIERMPEPNLFRRVVMSAEENPFDAWFRRRLEDPDFKSNADSVLGTGETGLYRSKDGRTAIEDLLHEFAHHFEKSQPLEAQLFHMARRLEGWTPRSYAATPRENWAVLVGEYAIHPESGPVQTLIQKAPLRAAMIGEAMYQRLSRIPVAERGVLHEFYMERALVLRREAMALAQQKLTEIAANNPTSKAGQNALKLLLFVGEPQHFQQLGSVRSINLSHEVSVGNTQVGRLNLLRGLEDVDLGNTHATTDGVMQLAKLPLTSLALRRVQFHDFGASSLPGTLRVIDLSRTPVTDGAIPSLIGLKHLNKIDVSDSGISPDGVRQLRAAFPDADITH